MPFQHVTRNASLDVPATKRNRIVNGEVITTQHESLPPAHIAPPLSAPPRDPHEVARQYAFDRKFRRRDGTTPRNDGRWYHRTLDQIDLIG